MMPAFGTPLLTDEYFDAKPMVLMVGSYSTGKTSFIKYLLEQDYPGIHAGPEPTTDRFQAIMYGPQERELPGHTLLANPASPFMGLSRERRSSLAGCRCIFSSQNGLRDVAPRARGEKGLLEGLTPLRGGSQLAAPATAPETK